MLTRIAANRTAALLKRSARKQRPADAPGGEADGAARPGASELAVSPTDSLKPAPELSPQIRAQSEASRKAALARTNARAQRNAGDGDTVRTAANASAAVAPSAAQIRLQTLLERIRAKASGQAASSGEGSGG